ncbi:CCA tRNA nucleotidyltransferase [Aeoliella mucimassa]|uniref:tRNA nucleotidyltransferase/poly(A) polymerase n=1 Tax=Aeoliella mucimassa TaxID=2527972 RepID=A0A518ARU5_9BACT|nr:CCA tRNA nucleotidyltransferase [Aeoliella mucimassa]QDU57449.1 tRNA nucleotidyltransferase/poly(A) polymerase [Aeoliella mucimassa]
MTNSPQRDYAIEVVRKLREAGYQSLWAGGCVRDALLGIAPKDYDVATSATPDEVRQVFGRRRTLAIGASFGVITVLGPKPAGQIEVATFRTDGGYSDGRHPDQVQYSTPEHDAQRRDFTINGLFYDPLSEQVLDFVGGEQDLKLGKIRAIGVPEQRIAEDKLRMLRAVRFASRFHFAIDPDTLAAIQTHASEINQVNGERIGSEMQSMLLHRHRASALALLRETTLEPLVLPECANYTGADWEELQRLVDSLSEPTFATVLAALMIDTPGEARIDTIAERWKLSNHDKDRASWLLDHLPLVVRATSTPWPRLQRVLIHEGAAELLTLATAKLGDDSPEVRFCAEKLQLSAEELNPAPLATGATLIAAGMKPGPNFGTLLEQIRDAQLNQQISTVEEALAMAQSL